MNYIELTIETTEAGTEVVSARLDMLGISQTSIIPGNNEINAIMRDTKKYWDYADESALNKQPAVQAYIEDDGNTENGNAEKTVQAVRNSMHELKEMENDLGFDLGTLEIKTKRVAEQDWANNWKAYFKPMPVGEKLLICPSWEEPAKDSGRIVLRIDPGMAFGTGTHHTTRMCLELLEKYVKNGSVVADLGCGSGILSIAAALLGAKEVYAVDIDENASKIAGENAQINGVNMDSLFIRTGDILTDKAFKADIASRKFDIVTANIVANVLIEFAPVAGELLKENGTFIASGIIDDRLDEVLSAFKENGLKIITVLTGENWRAVAAEKA